LAIFRSLYRGAAARQGAAVDFAKVDVVSFDLFQTLVQGPLETERQRLSLLDAVALDLSGGVLRDFANVRLRSKHWVEERLGEEVSLWQRYRAIARRYHIDEEVVRTLMRAEMDLDLRLSRPVPVVQQWFLSALEQGKAVCIVSDTPYPRDFIERLLDRNGYRGYQKLYLSSELGLLKNTGRLFRHVLADLAIEPARLLHIGDHPVSDDRRPAELGIRTQRRPPAHELFRSQARGASEFRYGDPRVAVWIRGLVARRFGGRFRSEAVPSFVGIGAEQLGYSVFGPMLLGFSLWLCRALVRDGVDRAFFLSRDGRVMKAAYDRLRALRSELPPSVYLQASRRGTALPCVREREQLPSLLQLPASPMPLWALLHHRYGLTDAEMARISPRDFGFDDLQSSAQLERDRDRLCRLLDALAPAVLSRAEGERRNLLGYYAAQGLFSARAPAVVDIGHQGTLQRAIAELCDRSDLRGYYFATVEALDTRLLARSFVGFASDDASTLANYERRIQLFELLFLSDEESFVRMQSLGGQWRAETLPLPGDGPRQEFARALHRGALEFIDDVALAVGRELLDWQLPAPEAIAPYLALLARPCRADAEPFRGIELENAFGGRAGRGVVDSLSTNAVWPEGKRALSGAIDPGIPLWGRWLDVAARSGPPLRKLRKLLRDPRAFLRDSRYRPFRRLGGGR
jgi:FMN phosphatase YigB (HAD superfamily)